MLKKMYIISYAILLLSIIISIVLSVYTFKTTNYSLEANIYGTNILSYKKEVELSYKPNNDIWPFRLYLLSLILFGFYSLYYFIGDNKKSKNVILLITLLLIIVPIMICFTYYKMNFDRAIYFEAYYSDIYDCIIYESAYKINNYIINSANVIIVLMPILFVVNLIYYILSFIKGGKNNE